MGRGQKSHKKYKSHKAILIWELGNEYNYHPEWFDGDIKNWYTALNTATHLIHLEDPNHPVSTAHGDIPETQALALNPNLDLGVATSIRNLSINFLTLS